MENEAGQAGDKWTDDDANRYGVYMNNNRLDNKTIILKSIKMKKKFKIFEISSKIIHVPSTDYYARNNQPENENIDTLIPIIIYDSDGRGIHTFETEDEAIIELEKLGKGRYTILSVFIK